MTRIERHARTQLIDATDLRALLFWAAIGISNSVGGSYDYAAGKDGLVATLAKQMGFSLSSKPLFSQRRERA